MEATEVEYATEYYDESPKRPSLSPATRKRLHDEIEADIDELSSMSESEVQAEVQAIMDARERKQEEDTRRFLEYRRSLKGEEHSQFSCGSFLILISVQPPAAALPRTTAPPPWHSSASSQMDRLRVRSPRTCATQVRAGVRLPFTKVVSAQSFAGRQHSRPLFPRAPGFQSNTLRRSHQATSHPTW